MTLEYKNREEVPNKYKIDFTKIYKSDEDWYKDLEYIKLHSNDLAKYKNHLLDNEHILEEWLDISNNLEMTIENLYVYAMVNRDLDISNSTYTKMYNEIVAADTTYEANTAFITVELLKSDYSKVKELINKNSNLEKYKFSFECLYRYKEHNLSEKEEQIISLYSEVFNGFSNIASIMENAEIKYGKIKVDGKYKELTSTNGLIFATNKDRSVRKKANKQKLNKIGEFNSTFTTNLTSYLKANDITSKLRGFKNLEEEMLYADNVNKEIYDNIIKFASNNIDIHQRWYKIIARCLNLKKLYNYDLRAPLMKDYDKKYTIEQAQDIIKKTLSIMGEEYLKVVDKAIDEQWIDYATYPNKRSGAYSIASYNANPLIVTSFKGFLSDISAIIHELGHSVHSYLSNTNNDYANAEYKIFVAEVASLTNEILLSDYIIKNSNDNKEKLASIYNIIEIICDNFFGAAFYAEFERELNDKINKGIILSKEDINDKWFKLLKKYYCPAVNYDDASKYSWSVISHFYSPFYTYKYTIGITGACYVATNIINKTPGFIDKYIKFLKSGNSDYPMNLLKELGIDLANDEPFAATMNLLNDYMDKFETLYKEVNNEQ